MKKEDPAWKKRIFTARKKYHALIQECTAEQKRLFARMNNELRENGLPCAEELLSNLLSTNSAEVPSTEKLITATRIMQKYKKNIESSMGGTVTHCTDSNSLDSLFSAMSVHSTESMDL